MTSTATIPAQSGHPTPRQALPDAARAAELRAANINPRTGLATDYLNHFNEAVMLLEMIPDMPECAEDFLAWHPLSYAEHFTASNFKARDLAISAYNSADPIIRAEFDSITDSMTSILKAVSAAMQEARFVIEDIAPNWKEYHHRLMDYNNDPRTTFADIQKVLRLLEKRITKRLREESGSDKK